MSLTEIIIYLVLFVGITLAVMIPAFRWYTLNTGMVQKKKHAIIIVAVIFISLLAAVIYSILI
jgi:hypothetical protein